MAHVRLSPALAGLLFAGFLIPAEGGNLSTLRQTTCPASAGLFVEVAPSLNLRRRASNFPQCLFAQDIGIAFPGFCKIDDLRDDGLFDAIIAISNPQSDANHFEGNA
jgi:hypothetical protein